MKERCYSFVHSLEPDFDTYTGDATNCAVRDLKSLLISYCFLSFLPIIFFVPAFLSISMVCNSKLRQT